MNLPTLVGVGVSLDVLDVLDVWSFFVDSACFDVEVAFPIAFAVFPVRDVAVGLDEDVVPM